MLCIHKNINLVVTALVSFFLILINNFAYSEGTKQINPNSSDSSIIQIVANVPGSTATFASYSSTKFQRLNVHICEAGETVYMGFNSKLPAKFRVKDPNGNIVFAETSVPLKSDLSTTLGKINSHQEALAGPKLFNPIGYNPLSFQANVVGDYYIEFDISARNPTTGYEKGIDMFDITVADINGIPKLGRLWSNAWQFNSGKLDNAFNGSLYIYTTDKIVTKINLNGFKPFEFIVSSNNTGSSNTGNVNKDRQSTTGNAIVPLYQIFLNNPDEDCYSSGDIGSIIGIPTVSGCPGKYCLNMNVNAPGEAFILLDLNEVNDYQEGTKDRLIQYTLLKGKNCIPWDGLDGLGNLLSSSLPISINVKYKNGITHLPIFDVEKNPNGYIVEYVRPIPTVGNTEVSLFWDDSKISGTKSPINGCTGGCHTWTGPAGSQNTLGNDRTTNTWWYVAEESVDIVFDFKKQSIDANSSKLGSGKSNDTSTCSSIKEIKLNGSLGGDTLSKWSILNGTGSFGNADTLNTMYLLSSADATLDSLIIVLSSINLVSCPVVKDTMVIHLEAVPKITMPTSFQICTNNPTISTSASFVNAKGLVWSGNKGKFVDSLKTAIVYSPSQTELNANLVKLYVKTIANLGQLCSMIQDSVEIKVYSPQTFKAPKDTIVCFNSTPINLNLSVTSVGSDSIVWANTGVINVLQKGLSNDFLINNASSFDVYMTSYKLGCLPLQDTVNVKTKNTPAPKVVDKIYCQ